MIEIKEEKDSCRFDHLNFDQIIAYDELTKLKVKSPLKKTTTVTNMTEVIDGVLTSICVVSNCMTDYKVAAVHRGREAFTMSVTFRYDAREPVIYGHYCPENAQTKNKRAMAYFTNQIGKFTLESQTIDGYHYSLGTVLNIPYNRNRKKIESIGTSVIDSLMSIIDAAFPDGTYINIANRTEGLLKMCSATLVGLSEGLPIKNEE